MTAATELPRTIFVGRGRSTVCWYRCALPALALGLDWAGVAGDPPDLLALTGNVGDAVRLTDLERYDVVVVQMPATPAWQSAISRLRAGGTRVLVEMDDYVHAIRKMGDHDLRHRFDKAALAEYDRSMALADGLVVSTEYLARRYAAHCRTTYLCRNGLDLGRFELTLPERPHVTVGWAGGTGHREALRPWLPAVAEVLRRRETSRFATVGQPWADLLEGEFGARTRSLPFSPLDSYPAAMTHFDIALAPAGRNGFFRGKSDLRWLEASALGIPVIADPVVYPEIEDGVTGFHARTPDEVRDRLTELIDDPGLRLRVGAAARRHVREHRSARAMAGQWALALTSAVGTTVAAA